MHSRELQMSGVLSANENKTLTKERKMGNQYLMRKTTHRGSYQIIELTLGTGDRARYNESRRDRALITFTDRPEFSHHMSMRGTRMLKTTDHPAHLQHQTHPIQPKPAISKQRLIPSPHIQKHLTEDAHTH